MRANFSCVLKKCQGKFDCLVYEMLFIQELRPSLNTQSDSISAKLVVKFVAYFLMNYCFFLYLKNIHTISFSFDNDVRERQNVVHFLTAF